MYSDFDELQAFAAVRLSQRIADALDKLPEGEAEAKFEAISRQDCYLKVDHSSGWATYFVQGEPFLRCLTSYLYGPGYMAVFERLAEGEAPDRPEAVLTDATAQPAG
jgi:hypothetical protein